MQQIITSASVLFHRFFVFQSFKNVNRFDIAVTCIFISSKIEESPIKLDDLIQAYLELLGTNKVDIVSSCSCSVFHEIDINFTFYSFYFSA